MEGYITPNNMAIVAGVLVLLVAYAVFSALTPSESKALSSAQGNYAMYSKVTKLAPLGCPQPEEYRLCDFYLASSSYSVFPGAKVFDYVSDSILPLAIKAGVRLIELDIYADESNKPVVGLKNQILLLLPFQLIHLF